MTKSANLSQKNRLFQEKIGCLFSVVSEKELEVAALDFVTFMKLLNKKELEEFLGQKYKIGDKSFELRDFLVEISAKNISGDILRKIGYVKNFIDLGSAVDFRDEVSLKKLRLLQKYDSYLHKVYKNEKFSEEEQEKFRDLNSLLVDNLKKVNENQELWQEISFYNYRVVEEFKILVNEIRQIYQKNNVLLAADKGMKDLLDNAQSNIDVYLDKYDKKQAEAKLGNETYHNGSKQAPFKAAEPKTLLSDVSHQRQLQQMRQQAEYMSRLKPHRDRYNYLRFLAEGGFAERMSQQEQDELLQLNQHFKKLTQECRLPANFWDEKKNETWAQKTNFATAKEMQGGVSFSESSNAQGATASSVASNLQRDVQEQRRRGDSIQRGYASVKKALGKLLHRHQTAEISGGSDTQNQEGASAQPSRPRNMASSISKLFSRKRRVAVGLAPVQETKPPSPTPSNTSSQQVDELQANEFEI